MTSDNRGLVCVRVRYGKRCSQRDAISGISGSWDPTIDRVSLADSTRSRDTPVQYGFPEIAAIRVQLELFRKWRYVWQSVARWKLASFFGVG